MLTLPQLKALAKQNKIRCTYLNKDEIIARLIDNNVITTSDIINPEFVVNYKEPVVKRDVDKNKYEYLKGRRNNPKTVEVFDRQTGETNTYTSTYKVRRALKLSLTYIKDNSVWKNRYEIKIKIGLP